MIEELQKAIGVDDRRALTIALELFRATRDGAVADVIDGLSARVASQNLSRKLDHDTLHEEWLELARMQRPEDVPALIEAVPRKVELEGGSRMLQPLETRLARLYQRLPLLAKLPDDPRVSRGLVEVVRRAPWSGMFTSPPDAIYDPILTIIARIADPRAVPELRELIERPRWKLQAVRNYMLAHLPSVIAAIDEHPRLSAGADALARTFATPGKRAENGMSADQLYAAVYDDPDDDSARQVLADLLLEQGDPRGEMIALQFKLHEGTATEKERKRVASLIRAHQEEWLGEVAVVTKKREFRRGFLDEAELVSEGSADPGVWERVLVDPRLATLRKLHKGKANEELYIRFFGSTARRSFRTLRAPTIATVRAIAQARAPLQSVETFALERPSREALDVLANTTALPALQCLRVTGELARLPTLYKALRGHPILDRIRTLEVDLPRSWLHIPAAQILDDLTVLGPHREVAVRYVGERIRAHRDDGELVLSIESRIVSELPMRIAHLPNCAPVVELDPSLHKLFMEIAS